MERDFKGVWIPKEIYLNKKLSWTERILLIEINSLDGKNGCFASNAYLSEFLGVREENISRAISKLKKLGYIYQTNFDGRTRVLKSNIHKVSEDIDNTENKADLTKTSRQTEPKRQGSFDENVKGFKSDRPCGTKGDEQFFSPNNTINNTSNNIKKEEPQKNPSKNSYEKIIDTYTDDPELKETILEFIKMRKLKKKPPTDKALALILKKLDKLSNTTSGKIEILEQSIIRCYEDVFEIKQDYKSQYGKQNKEPTGMDALKELADEWGVQLP